MGGNFPVTIQTMSVIVILKFLRDEIAAFLRIAYIFRANDTTVDIPFFEIFIILNYKKKLQ